MACPSSFSTICTSNCAHELIGLEAKVKGKSRDSLKGLIVDETKNLVVLETEQGIKKVPKTEASFEIALGKEKVLISGKSILARPEDRIKFAWRSRNG